MVIRAESRSAGFNGGLPMRDFLAFFFMHTVYIMSANLSRVFFAFLHIFPLQARRTSCFNPSANFRTVPERSTAEVDWKRHPSG